MSHRKGTALHCIVACDLLNVVCLLIGIPSPRIPESQNSRSSLCIQPGPFLGLPREMVIHCVLKEGLTLGPCHHLDHLSAGTIVGPVKTLG